MISNADLATEFFSHREHRGHRENISQKEKGKIKNRWVSIVFLTGRMK
jgi:hypothetical protein